MEWLSNLASNPSVTNALASAAVGGLNRYMGTPERNRQMRLQSAMARWSPYTGDNTWAQMAMKSQKTGAQDLVDNLRKGLGAEPGGEGDYVTLFKNLTKGKEPVHEDAPDRRMGRDPQPMQAQAIQDATVPHTGLEAFARQLQAEM